MIAQPVLAGPVTQTLSVGLSPWIIGEGNYADFIVGEHRAFAVEFYAPQNLRRVRSGRRSFVHRERCHYTIVGRPTLVASDWWVIDFGVPVFTNTAPPVDYRVGDLLSGDVCLGVDPFFYFVDLAKRRDAPPLIFDWRIDRIEMETGPFIESGAGPVRDAGRAVQQDVDRTGRPQHEDGAPEYTLHCTRLSDKGRHRI